MDDMAKLKVGAPAVSRYHNIRRLFATSNAPNYKDHDFPVPNYLLSVSGYMILEDHTFDNTSTASTVVNDVECYTSDNTYDRSLEVSNHNGSLKILTGLQSKQMRIVIFGMILCINVCIR